MTTKTSNTCTSFSPQFNINVKYQVQQHQVFFWIKAANGEEKTIGDNDMPMTLAGKQSRNEQGFTVAQQVTLFLRKWYISLWPLERIKKRIKEKRANTKHE